MLVHYDYFLRISVYLILPERHKILWEQGPLLKTFCKIQLLVQLGSHYVNLLIVPLKCFIQIEQSMANYPITRMKFNEAEGSYEKHFLGPKPRRARSVIVC